MLGFALMVPVAAVLAACGTAAKVEALVTDPKIGELADKVKKLVDGWGLLPSQVSGKVSTTIQGLLADLGAVATSISNVKSLVDAKPLIGQLGTLIFDIVAVIPAKSVSPKVTELIAAGLSYLPTIESIVGLFGARRPGARRFAAMRPDDAERVLVAAAATSSLRR